MASRRRQPAPARIGEVVEINRRSCCGMLTHSSTLIYTPSGWATLGGVGVEVNDKMGIRFLKLAAKNRQRGGRFVGDPLWPNDSTVEAAAWAGGQRLGPLQLDAVPREVTVSPEA